MYLLLGYLVIGKTLLTESTKYSDVTYCWICEHLPFWDACLTWAIEEIILLRDEMPNT